MKLVKSLLLGSAAGLFAVAGAQAADLPVRKAAPVEYVRVCTAQGAGFFYIPGTDTCLRIGGRARFEYQFTQTRNRNSSDSGYAAQARFSFDARTQTSYGTLRAFLRLDIRSRTGGYLKSGTQERFANAFTGTGQDTISQAQKYVEVDKAFIQFAGFTAGRANSFFDFYAHDLEFISSSVGSDVASTNLFAYTATFGTGFSATVSAEDPTFRRNPVFANIVGGVLANGVNASQAGVNFLSGGSAFAQVGNAFAANGVATSVLTLDAAQRNNVPDFVGAIRYDAPWGSAQVSGASHEIRVGNYSGGALPFNGGVAVPVGTPGTVAPRVPGSEYGYAAQAGVKINLPQIAPGDVLWLQAAYADGASSYTGVFGNQGSESIAANDTGRANFSGVDAFVDSRGQIRKTESYSGTISFLHFWTPEIRQALFASYGRVEFDRNIRNAAGTTIGNFAGANAFAVTAAGGIFSPIGKDYGHTYIGTNLIWSPVRDLDIGVEAIYDRLEFLGGASRGRAIDTNKPVTFAGGVPKTVTHDDEVLVRMRVQRDF